MCGRRMHHLKGTGGGAHLRARVMHTPPTFAI